MEEGLDVIRAHDPQIQEIDELHVPDEAFYRSLNQAYEEELVSSDPLDPLGPTSQLDMIWEEREEEETDKKRTPIQENMDDEEEIYSALDYKDYRGNSSCVSEQDIAELSRIDSIDHMAMEKLNELDRLSSKLQQDSVNIKQLQRKLLESPISLGGINEEPTSDNQEVEEKWTFSSEVRDQNDLMMVAKSELPNNTTYSTRPNSRLSVTESDKEVAEALAGGMRTPTSPRRRQDSASSEPFSTVDGRLAYSAAVQHVESAEAAAAAAAIINSTNPFYCGDFFKPPSPTLSICSVRTRQDGYVDPEKPSTYSPPPPAPNENNFLSSNAFLGPSAHSPRSPKTSPKRSKSHSSNIVTVKSDSGLSSMSGWSSLEKSPENVKSQHYFSFTNKKIPEDNNEVLPGGHPLSAFTSVKSPNNIQLDGYGTFVPAPAPASDINVSPNRNKAAEQTTVQPKTYNMYSSQPAIYSVAGSNNKDSYTSVYTSNSADYINQTINYPDLVEPYESEAASAPYYNPPAPQEDETSLRRRSLTRSYSTNKPPDGLSNHEGYKTAMYRTMFPTGNITDALSYYPTSSRMFQEAQDTASTSSSKETSETGYSPYMDRRQQPIYENQQQIDQHQRNWQQQRQDASRLDLDLRNRNVPEYVVQQRHIEGGIEVIMTQSGEYITINNSSHQDKKKLKRGSTLKSAMNSVSNWLPDLHLKRHRSYSLPGGIKKEEVDKTRQGTKKKKRNAIVSTVSGILQKAKRKAHGSHQSLSDPEQSENEWVIKRASSVVSEDDRSEDSTSMSENLFEKELFAKISPKPKSRKSSKSDEETRETITTTAAELQLYEEDKSTGSGSSNIFPTVGETKKSSGSSDKSDETVIMDSKMIVVVGGGTSMEFAVSRALGKYRQRHSNSFTDDQVPENEEIGVKIEEVYEEEEPAKTPPKVIEQKSVESDTNNKSEAEGSPSFRGRTFPRHQQSLEIPSHRGDDEDSKSTHSWRSTSRVSSRRQSTEDSIDSEDEWYCYELRKLEEMERQKELEQDMGSTLIEEPELEDEERYEPEEEVKEKMSFVLRELRMKAKVVEGVLDQKDHNLLTVKAAKKRGSFHLDEAAALFEKIKIYHHESLERERLEEEKKQQQQIQYLEEPAKDEDDRSSGATSGPDSPHQSTDEYDELEMKINDEFARCHLTNEEEEEKLNREAASNQYNKQTSPDQTIPQIHVASPTPNKEEAPQDKDTPGSKWKLLKTLKERKAEEKNNQTKPVVEPVQPPKEEKVSMLGMMKSFYEIHVKT